MRIAVLSRSANIYSTYRIMLAARNKGHHAFSVDHIMCDLLIKDNKPVVYFRDEEVKYVDAIVPRIGASVTFYGASVIQHFEMQGVYATVGSEQLLSARNKLRSLQKLTNAGIGMPDTVFTHYMNTPGRNLAHFNDETVVIKMLEGTQGLGVMLAKDRTSAKSMVEAFGKMRKRFMIQEFIRESSGTDIRIFIVGGEIVASMKRQAPKGEFRSNLHRGGTGTKVTLTEEEAHVALRAVEVLDLKVAGVDLLRSNRGPLLLEVNPSPGLEGIEGATRVDIATKIIEMIERDLNHRL